MHDFSGFSRDVIKRVSDSLFYKNILHQQGLLPTDLSSPESIKYFPIVDRRTLVNFADEILSYVQDDTTFPIWSSGTTGTPVQVYRSEKDNIRYWKLVSSYFHTTLKELNIFFLCSLISGTEYDVTIRCGENYHRIKRMNLFKSPIKIIESLQSQWDVLTGSPMGCGWLLQQNTHPNVKYLITTALELPFEIRNLIKNKWDLEALHLYSTTETGPIGWQCKLDAKTYHVFPDVFVEAENTSILITKNFESSFPLIRYRTGDLGSVRYGTCDCGFYGGIISKLKGRK